MYLNIPNEANIMLNNIESNTFLLNFIASNLSSPLEEKQKMLETTYLPDLPICCWRRCMKNLASSTQGSDRIKGQKWLREATTWLFFTTIEDHSGGAGSEYLWRRAQDNRRESKGKKWSVEVKSAFDKEFAKLKHAWIPKCRNMVFRLII